MRSYMLTVYSGAATGRLLVHDPATGATEVLQEGLWFANGVALVADESFVAVVETPSMRVRRHWLKGPKVSWAVTGTGRLDQGRGRSGLLCARCRRMQLHAGMRVWLAKQATAQATPLLHPTLPALPQTQPLRLAPWTL